MESPDIPGRFKPRSVRCRSAALGLAAWVVSKRHRFRQSWDGFAPFDQLGQVIVVLVIGGDWQAKSGAQP